MAESDTAPQDPKALTGTKLENELRWTLRRLKILFTSWTTPVNSPVVNTFTPDDGVSARAFALVLIVALAFAVRGDPVAATGTTFTALAGGLAVVMSFILNFASRTLGVNASERLILSAYVSTILVMFSFFLIDISVRSVPSLELISEYAADYVGPRHAQAVVVVVLSVLIIFALLLLKAWRVDKFKPNRAALVHAAALTIGSGLIVLLVNSLGSGTWTFVWKCLKSPGLGCADGFTNWVKP
jgi:hypothetical protein